MNFKAVIIEMLQQEIINSLKANEKIENFSKEWKLINKKQMQILELKNNLIEIKNSADEPCHRVEITEGRIGEVENRSIEFNQTK